MLVKTVNIILAVSCYRTLICLLELLFIFSFRTRLEVHKNVKSGTKPSKAHQEPVVSRRMTRSQTKSAQNKELSQATAQPAATQAKIRRNKVKTPSKTPKPFSQLGMDTEH